MSIPRADGIHADVSRAEYDLIDRCNFSTLKHIGRSAAHYKHALANQQEDSDAKRLGRIRHLMVLEHEKAASEIVVWDGGVRRGKDWDAFRVRNAGKELLNEKEFEECSALAVSVLKDPIASKLISGGHAEVTMLWTQVETPCKGRMDYLAPTHIADLKTTKNASPDGFGKEVWNYKSHAQAAWYLDGYERATGIRLPYYLIAVENFAPYVCQTYLVPELVLDAGRKEYQGWLDRLNQCRATKNWPAYHDAVLELTLPRWALDVGEDDEDLSGLDLIGGTK